MTTYDCKARHSFFSSKPFSNDINLTQDLRYPACILHLRQQNDELAETLTFELKISCLRHDAWVF
jgi:hypothetical protein